MATYVYSSAQAHINNEQYKLEVLEGYEPNVPTEMIEGVEELGPGPGALFGTGITGGKSAPKTICGLIAMRAPRTGRLNNTDARRFYPKPIFQPEASRIVRANLTIAHMIDMSATDKYYKILNDLDALEMLHTVDSYLNEIRQLVQDQNAVVIAYVRRVLIYRAKLVRCVRGIFNRHPDWKDAYWRQAGASTPTLKTMLQFVQAMCPNASTLTMDPMERIANPPYYISDAGKLMVPGQAVSAPKPAMTQEELKKHIGPAGISNLTYRRPNPQ